MGGLCAERYGGLGGEWIVLARAGGIETGGGDDRKMGSVTKKKGKQKSTTRFGASLTPDVRDKEESNNNSSPSGRLHTDINH